ncbi:MAG: 3-hydroxyacyl-CoA dehydrogenase family protein [Actinophytocola sp.]|uniref:3-hydroxyacyl-CoA dehydrogenase family protein n=1 Tax=Actinophytocola sp. TaxID=1872138 RepID=UPI003D6ADB85
MGTRAIRDRAVRSSWSRRRVGVVGSGYMGQGIAQVLAAAGAHVVVLDIDGDRAAASLAHLRTQARAFEARGLWPAGRAEQVAARTAAAASMADGLPGTDLVVEAVVEDVRVKRDVLAAIEQHAPAAAPIATNTSSIPIAELAVALGDPSRLLGVHWFNPPQFVPGVEIIPGPGTDESTVTWLVALLRAAGKSPAVVSDGPGFVANRLQFALFREAALLVEEGVAEPEQVDEVVRHSFGFRLPFFGPFAIADMAGLDVYAGAFDTLRRAYGERFAPPPALSELVARGRLGTKSGGGFLALDQIQTRAMLARRDSDYARLLELLAADPDDTDAHADAQGAPR